MSFIIVLDEIKEQPGHADRDVIEKAEKDLLQMLILCLQTSKNYMGYL